MQATARRRTLGLFVLGFLVVAAVLAIPAQGYLAQRSESRSLEAELASLERDNAELQERREQLDDPDEIRRIARRDYGLVAVGEESYSVLPPPTAGLVLPSGWPFDRISDSLVEATSGES